MAVESHISKYPFCETCHVVRDAIEVIRSDFPNMDVVITQCNPTDISVGKLLFGGPKVDLIAMVANKGRLERLKQMRQDGQEEDKDIIFTTSRADLTITGVCPEITRQIAVNVATKIADTLKTR